ncbi:homoserine O-succinyltransferase [Vibrio cincinnatiensis]|uniref:Homoserine O-succinyltransferase n=1 Tax=Vibrio cincinnatiensis DSM 19608 TaxID=1123491 RepID=A0A1T4KVK9_VIBCI|nr:homoserine O-succinyltransferase [Vibrio cincinnatiensis]MCG3723853.1 homoserine O-succinyltransferase [Vibrio cincinnatiensis]MCG3727289.1 homoserine O-succinyltransferase [Vibrio cincinnatiensis]MCG3733484.1 homoserine O-succinyltransferase [Vibrio cincinnatiensis]MCG3737654.1 homoserine O-succinyltransferase [Vibrio cincinnatiensis]MCG3740814.1 homoserine O-succinyltransferase [Vibrio cincinnatiensis]
MPIKIPDQLPATDVLRKENIFIMAESRASTQEIRPLKVLLLNLMPKKIETETQFLRLLSNSPLQVDIELLRIDDRPSKNTPEEHLNAFYRQFDMVQHRNFDGLIITGAPLGLVQFKDVAYWEHLQHIMTWAKDHVTSTLYVCWAAQAALKLLYNLPKQTRDEKLSGVYHHDIHQPFHPLLRGFDDTFLAPHSRYADFEADYLAQHTNLDLLATSEVAGVYLASTKDKRHVFVTGHPEYDAHTLHQEYIRDLAEGQQPPIPVNYYPNDNPDNKPRASWRSHGHLLFSNWLNYCVYQQTPYDLEHFSEDRFTKDD